jgi:hypothetical protein
MRLNSMLLITVFKKLLRPFYKKTAKPASKIAFPFFPDFTEKYLTATLSNAALL